MLEKLGICWKKNSAGSGVGCIVVDDDTTEPKGTKSEWSAKDVVKLFMPPKMGKQTHR